MLIMHHVQSEKTPTTVHVNGRVSSLITLLVHVAFIKLCIHNMTFSLIDGSFWQCLRN